MEYKEALEIMEKVIAHYKWCLEQKGVVDVDMTKINEAFNKIRNG
jgi:ppGpp synthetase/RelA/SpoT-type nucleotidyltranferase